MAEVVTIVVGKSEEMDDEGVGDIPASPGSGNQLFVVHKSLLTCSSKYFLAALNGKWEESKGLVKLPGVSFGDFGIYVNYLYFRKLFTGSNSSATPRRDREWSLLRNLYILGDHLQAEGFKNAVIDAMIEKHGEYSIYPAHLATRTYENTLPSSPLRRLLVDFHVWVGKGFSKSARDLPDITSSPREFLMDVVLALTDAGPKLEDPKVVKPWKADGCAYHEHKYTPPCAKK